MPVITDLVASVLARLQEPGALPYVQAFEQLPERLTPRRDEVFQEAMRRLRNRSPFVLAAAGDIRAVTGKTGGTAPEWRCDLDVFVYCGGDHRSSLTEGRLDPDSVAAADPLADQGIRCLLEDTFALLAGWSPLSATMRMNPVRGSTVILANALTIWEWTFSTQVALVSRPLPPRAQFAQVRVHNQTATTPPAIIASEDLS